MSTNCALSNIHDTNVVQRRRLYVKIPQQILLIPASMPQSNRKPTPKTSIIQTAATAARRVLDWNPNPRIRLLVCGLT